MKLSFSLPSKSSSSSSSNPNLSKPSNQFNHKTLDHGPSHHSKQYVNEFDASKPFSQSRTEAVVIPALENEWRPMKKMKNLEAPLAQSNESDLQFETASGLDPIDDSKIAYGLNVRQSVDAVNGGDDVSKLLPRSAPLEAVMLQKLKVDLERLPDDEGFEEFEKVPVESFAAALMEGYGWRQGRGIGKNAKEDVKVKEINRRTDKQGLGFVDNVPAALPINQVRNGDKGRERVRNGDEGRERVRNRDEGRERVRSREEGGERERNREGGERERNRDEVRERERNRDEGRERERNRDEGREHERDEGRERKRNRDEGREHKRNRGKVVDVEKRSSSSISWLTSHIRVRFISKGFKGGKFYLKKGKILDVVGPSLCDVSLDETRELVQGVPQDLLETALPRRGGPVLVLYGKHKGVYGSLVEKDLDKESGIVRDADSHELVNVRLEQIAEYIGDPSDLGY